MALPTFAMPSPAPAPEMLTRTQIAARLELHLAGVDKLIRAGMLSPPFYVSDLVPLTGRPKLTVVEGELTVLRTDARAVADPQEMPRRRYIGFHAEHSNEELEAASLRWWRSDPDRILDNELFVVTLATFPVALYRITQRLDTITRAGEDRPRHQYEGQLLARVHPGMQSVLSRDTPGYLRKPAQQVMSSRIAVASGGPIGYLEP